jgi:signal transduction histidine kinase
VSNNSRVLDVARVTTGKIELNRQATNLAECVRVCVNALENPLLAYDLKVEAEPAWVDGDSIRLEQICARETKTRPETDS